MRRMRSHAFVLPLILLLGAVASCSTDNPAAPAEQVAEPNASFLGDLIAATDDVGSSVNGLIACPHDERYVGSATIGPDGGTIRVGPHWLYVPAGALDNTVLITADAPAGNTVRVDFNPEGLRFRQKAVLTLSYRDCGALSLPLHVVYVGNDLKIVEVLPSLPNPWTRTVSARIEHFSWYALAD